LTGKLHKFSNDKDGYLNACLTNGKHHKTHRVHRIVAIAFIDNPENKQNINHIDFNKENNCITNIEWCTQSENVNHSYINGRVNPPSYWLGKSSYEHHSSKKVFKYDASNVLLAKYGSANEAARQHNVKPAHICEVCRGVRNQYLGYIWKYN